MVEDRESLLRSLKRYLTDLEESGVDELSFAARPAPEPACRLDGPPRARLLFVMTGSGFEGASGALLEKIVAAMGFSRQEICLLSLDFDPGTAADDRRRLVADRVFGVGPEVVVTMGEESTRLLLAKNLPLERLRGSFHDYNGVPLMPSHHPDALLANQALKREVWNDMQQVMKHLGQAR